MRHASLAQFLKRDRSALRAGPVALVLVEDDVEVASTLHHHLDRGFAQVIALMPPGFPLPEGLQDRVHRIDHTLGPDAPFEAAVNAVIRAAPGCWLYYCFNAEYLFYPFCETRSVGEMLAFHAEERRDAMLAYVVDLYADDLARDPGAVSRERAHLDRAGYYALARTDAAGQPCERQLDVFGGVRWRFEEHIPPERRRIDRIALFRAKPGLTLRSDHTFSDPEYNTYACPWHHNLTAAVCSFRTAKALKANPGSSERIATFRWHNSEPFEWNSRQLLDLGLIESGQWF
ncbi:hypothetical protein R5H30_11875 [Sulfitobacter sp. D35]|uniref:hypothetical protein n=1 Tax=Sulfitobacter sp. D35 TaxID=3083252 RepID=UPI00296F7565|nr:hypothetical protein [Sulfitobacter sp. D35]MDW4498684.1 hypothetical protein [Sulfitobacter sp. D35]